MTSTEHVERLRYGNVLLRSYLDAGRHLVRLALPSVLVHVPLLTLSLLVLMVTAGGSAALVDQRFQLIGTSDAPLLTWTIVLVTVALAGQLVVFPATVAIAAGHLVDRRVEPFEALRAAVRRLPSLLVLLLVAGTAWAAGAGVWMVADRRWTTVALLVVAAFAAMPGLLAVPGILLHGCSGPGAIRRAYQLTRLRFLPAASALAFGVVVVPGAGAWALDSGLRLLPGPVATLGWGLAGTAFALAVTPFQAAVVARQFLHRMAWRTQVDDADLAHGLPEGPPPRPAGPGFLAAALLPGRGFLAAALLPRRGLLAAALLPGLLFSGVVLVNPFGWPEISETYVTRSWTPPTPSGSGPELRPFDLQAVHTGRGERLIVVLDGYDDHASLLECADPACLETSFEWAEPPGRAARWEPGATGARLPDGRLLLTTWTSHSLGLLTCDGTRGCVRSSGAVATTRSRPESVGVAPAVREGGGLVLAYAEADPASGDRPAHDLISFIYCADPSCPRPERRQVARLESGVYSTNDHTLAAVVGPGDRPVAARYDPIRGQIHVITCSDAACHQPIVTSPVPAAASSPFRLAWTFGLSMAVRPDGRPVIAYRDPQDQANKLVDCRTSDCARADVRRLGAGNEYHAAPALVLDRAGRALVAYESREHQRLMLAGCDGSRCRSVPVSKNAGGFGERLAMTLNAEGDPTIVWIDHRLAPPGLSWNLHVTTPLNLTPHEGRDLRERFPAHFATGRKARSPPTMSEAGRVR